MLLGVSGKIQPILHPSAGKSANECLLFRVIIMIKIFLASRKECAIIAIQVDLIEFTGLEDRQVEFASVMV